jgi:hypothetical protein
VKACKVREKQLSSSDGFADSSIFYRLAFKVLCPHLLQDLFGGRMSSEGSIQFSNPLKYKSAKSMMETKPDLRASLSDSL